MPIIVEIKVVPSSGKQLCKIDKNGALKCYLKSAPERGLANDELITMLAKSLRIPRNALEIVAGATSRAKKIKIDKEMTLEQFLAQLGIEQQLKILD